MITNFKGWRDRRAAALARRANAASRREINNARWLAYTGEDGSPISNEVISEEITKLSAEMEGDTKELEKAIEAINPETLSNADLRATIEAAGFEVPKNTARARLLELYAEKVK